MSKFVLSRTLKLDEFGDEWKDCYIKLKEPTLNEVQKISNEVVNANTEKQVEAVKVVLESSFIEGKAFNGKEIVDLKKTDLSDLPISIYMKLSDFLLGSLPEKAKGSTSSKG